MKALTILGIILIILGAVALLEQGITYTHREKVIDIGPIQATAKQQRTILSSPVVGSVILAGGIVLVVAGARRSHR